MSEAPCNNCGKVAHGAISLFKVLFGIDASDATTVLARKAICEVCPHYEPSTFGFSTAHCGLCHCLLEAKVRLAAEQCPDLPPRWEKEKAS